VTVDEAELELLVLAEDEVVEMLPVVVVRVIVLELVEVELELPVWATMGVGKRTKVDPKTRMTIMSSNTPRFLFTNVHRSHC